MAAPLLFLTKMFGVEVNENRLSYDQKVSAFLRRLLFFFRLRALSSYKEPSVAYLLSQDPVLPMLGLIHQSEQLIRLLNSRVALNEGPNVEDFTDK